MTGQEVLLHASIRGKPDLSDRCVSSEVCFLPNQPGISLTFISVTEASRVNDRRGSDFYLQPGVYVKITANSDDPEIFAQDNMFQLQRYLREKFFGEGSIPESEQHVNPLHQIRLVPGRRDGDEMYFRLSFSVTTAQDVWKAFVPKGTLSSN